MSDVQEVGIKVNQVENKSTDKSWRISQRQSKDGQAKKGQKLSFASAIGTRAEIDAIPPDLNKITVAVPPGAHAIVTMSMSGGLGDRRIVFENTNPADEITGRIYIDRDTGEIHLARDPLLNTKIEGPATNQFQTRRQLQQLQPTQIEVTQQLSPNNKPITETTQLAKPDPHPLTQQQRALEAARQAQENARLQTIEREARQAEQMAAYKATQEATLEAVSKAQEQQKKRAAAQASALEKIMNTQFTNPGDKL